MTHILQCARPCAVQPQGSIGRPGGVVCSRPGVILIFTFFTTLARTSHGALAFSIATLGASGHTGSPALHGDALLRCCGGWIALWVRHPEIDSCCWRLRGLFGARWLQSPRFSPDVAPLILPVLWRYTLSVVAGR